MSDWFVKHRQEWIKEALYVYGYINREHIERKFGVSAPQASVDLKLFQNQNKDLIVYNKTSKRYEAK